MMPGVENQMRRGVARVLAGRQANVVTAVLHWREVEGRDDAVFDENDESSVAESGGEVVQKTREFRTFFHRVDHRLSGFQRYMEVQTGDVILDYLDDLELDGKEDARVEVAGEFFVQKSAGRDLLEAWDSHMGGVPLLKTMLLGPA